MCISTDKLVDVARPWEEGGASHSRRGVGGWRDPGGDGGGEL